MGKDITSPLLKKENNKGQSVPLAQRVLRGSWKVYKHYNLFTESVLLTHNLGTWTARKCSPLTQLASQCHLGLQITFTA